MKLKKVAIVYNPKGGSASKATVNELAGCFLSNNIEVEYLATTPEPGSATQHAKDALTRGAELVIAFGGDGTAEQVAEGVIGTSVPMAIYPGGTGNLFARSFYAEPTPEGFARMIMNGTPQPVDLIRAEYADMEGVQYKRLFLVGFGLGKLSDAISMASPFFKRIFGRLTYVFRVALACLWPDSRRFGLVRPEGESSVTAAGIFVLNVVPPMMAPLSRGLNASDGLMDVVVLEAMSFWQLLAVAFCMAFARPERCRHYRRFRTRELTIKCSKPRLPNIDGDPGVKTKEIKLSVIPGAVNMVLS